MNKIIGSSGMKLAYAYLNSSPEKNIPKPPLFMPYYKNQPFNENPLRTCPLLDNPEQLNAIVEASGAVSTDLIKPEGVRNLCAKCTEAADNWAVTADRLWDESHGCAGCRRRLMTPKHNYD